MHTTPLTDRFGVEIHDVDLGAIDADTYASVRNAFEHHSALLFRNQNIDDDAHMRLARSLARSRIVQPTNGPQARHSRCRRSAMCAATAA